jgi:hypothetical protein
MEKYKKYVGPIYAIKVSIMDVDALKDTEFEGLKNY